MSRTPTRPTRRGKREVVRVANSRRRVDLERCNSCRSRTLLLSRDGHLGLCLNCDVPCRIEAEAVQLFDERGREALALELVSGVSPGE